MTENHKHFVVSGLANDVIADADDFHDVFYVKHQPAADGSDWVVKSPQGTTVGRFETITGAFHEAVCRTAGISRVYWVDEAGVRQVSTDFGDDL